ncbi:MAG: hypothetical protein LBL86_07290 [Coriobacteriales bacterium]|jgi:hypothetical protein|nr:hypothetical protein [Coriobacteriales bacterium]
MRAFDYRYYRKYGESRGSDIIPVVLCLLACASSAFLAVALMCSGVIGFAVFHVAVAVFYAFFAGFCLGIHVERLDILYGGAS